MAIKLGVSLYFLLITIVIFPLLSTQCKADAAGGGGSLVETTCGKTQFPPICTKTLESDPRSSTADLTSLSRIALELATTQVNATAALAHDLINNASDYQSWGLRVACFDDYNSSSHQLTDSALPSFDKKMYQSSSQAVDLASQSIQHCNNQGIAQLAAGTSLWQLLTDVKTIILGL